MSTRPTPQNTRSSESATRSVIAALRPEPFFDGFVKHLEWALRGARKPSLREARAWVKAVQAEAVADQRAIVARLFELKARYPDCRQLFAHPIWHDLIDPVAEAWLAEDAGNVEVLCGLGLLRNDLRYFERAWAADNRCQMACTRLVDGLLDDIAYRVAHLDEGQSGQDAAEVRRKLSEATHKLSFVDDLILREQLKGDAQRFEQVLNLFEAWRGSKRGTFAAYCEARGVSISGAKSMYH